MNLRVDLILDTERRSASVVTSKGALRILIILVPVILVGYFAIRFLAVSLLKQELAGLRTAYDNARPQQERAKALSAEFQSHRDILAELQGWNHSRLAWGQQLWGVMSVVPTNVQLQALAGTHMLQLTNNKPARVFALNLRGKALGGEAEQSVKRLETALLSAPPFQGQTADVTVPVYGANTEPTANRDDRVFQIVCPYDLRLFQ